MSERNSERNKAVLEAANAAVQLARYEEFLAFCTDDVVWEFVGDKTLRGKEAVRRYIRETYVEPPEFVVTELISEGDMLTAIGEISIKDKAGTSTRSAYCDVWRLRDGKLAGLRAFVIETSGSDG